MLKDTMFFPNEEQEQFIKANYIGKPNKALTEMFNQRFGTNYQVQQIKRYKNTRGLSSGLTGRFEKGCISWNKGTKGLTGPNKTSFKKGTIPPQHKPVGTVVKTRDGYLVEKVEEPNIWRYKHRMVWEEVNGPVPDEHCLVFADGNTENLDINNLILIKRRQLALLNRNNLLGCDADLSMSAVILTDLMLKIKDLKEGEDK